jgi:hypothetical protein
VLPFISIKCLVEQLLGKMKLQGGGKRCRARFYASKIRLLRQNFERWRFAGGGGGKNDLADPLAILL